MKKEKENLYINIYKSTNIYKQHDNIMFISQKDKY